MRRQYDGPACSPPRGQRQRCQSCDPQVKCWGVGLACMSWFPFGAWCLSVYDVMVTDLLNLNALFSRCRVLSVLIKSGFVPVRMLSDDGAAAGRNATASYRALFDHCFRGFVVLWSSLQQQRHGRSWRRGLEEARRCNPTGDAMTSMPCITT